MKSSRAVLLILSLAWISCDQPEPEEAEIPNKTPGEERQQPQVTDVTRQVREFVSRSFVHGVPYEEARKLGPAAVPVLIGLLKEPSQEQNLTNIVVTLGYIGDKRASQPLIDFLERTTGNVSDAKFDALLSVPSALGHLSRSGDERALSYLVAQSQPHQGTAPSWSFGSYKGSALHEEMEVMAARGLAVSGVDEACDELGELLALVDHEAKPSVRKGQSQCSEINRKGYVAWLKQSTQPGVVQQQKMSPPPPAVLAPGVPLAEVVQPMTAVRHVEVSITPDGLTRIFNTASDLLQVSQRESDVACRVRMQLSGTLGTFGRAGDGLNVVSSAEEMAELKSNPARFKIVTSIKFCDGKPADSALACADTPGRSIVIARRAAADVWAHEFGHNQGRRHRNDSPHFVMHEDACCTDEVNQDECTAFRRR